MILRALPHAITALLAAFVMIAKAHCASGYAPKDIPLGEVTTPEVALRHYREHPKRFLFLTPGELPKDLKWEDGADQKPYSSPDAKRGGTLRQFIWSYPNTLRKNGPNSNHAYRSLIYDNNSFALIGFHPNTRKHVPELASTWAMSADKRTCYFRLDPRARFSDGQPVTADDYFFTFYISQCEWIDDPFMADYYRKEFESITKYDDLTIAVTLPLAKPDPFFFTTITPTPRLFYREIGPDFTTRYQRRCEPVTGAYTILPEDYRINQSITLTRLDNWWGDEQPFLTHRFNPDKITLKVIREKEKTTQLFLNGESDMMWFPDTKYWYKINDEAAVKKGLIEKTLFYNDKPRPPYGLYLNTAKPPLDNREVRLGLAHATDWQRVINTFYLGDCERLNQFAQGYGEYTDTAIKARPYDIAEARKHFAAAGYDRQGGDGILVNRKGARLSVQILTSEGDRKKMLPAFIDSARKAGVELRPKSLEATAFYKTVMNKQHDIVLWGWSSSGYWPELWQHFHKDSARDKNGAPLTSTNNITSSDDAELSAMIDRFRTLTDESEMITLSKKMQRAVHDSAVFIPGYYFPGYRLAYWRRIKFPPHFDVRAGDDPLLFSLFWIDDEARLETEEAIKTGRSFGPQTHIYDAFRTE